MFPSQTISKLAQSIMGGILAVSVAAGQGTPTPTTGGGGTTGGGTTTTSPGGVGGTTTAPSVGRVPSTNPTTTNPTNPFPQETARPVFLTGKVMMEDGTPPPESVLIERICGGSPKPEGYTDSKGRFSIELGRNNQVFADASNSGGGFDGLSGRSSSSSPLGSSQGVTERSLMNCELRASLAGFRSSTINLAGHRLLDSPEVGTILLRRMANVEGFTFSMTTAMAPKDAKKAFDKGLDLLKKKKPAEALKEFEKATSAYPKFAAAFFEQGRLQEQQKDAEGAKKSYEQAVASDPKFVKPYLPLTMMAAQTGDWQTAADLSAKTTKLNPYEYPQAFFYNAVANLNLKNLDEAEKSALAAKKLDEKNRIPRINYVLGLIQAQKENYASAVEHIKSYINLSPQAGDLDTARKQLTEIERLAGGAKEVNQQP